MKKKEALMLLPCVGLFVGAVTLSIYNAVDNYRRDREVRRTEIAFDMYGRMSDEDREKVDDLLVEDEHISMWEAVNRVRSEKKGGDLYVS